MEMERDVVEIDLNSMIKSLEELANIGKEGPNGGTTRLTFTEADIHARRFIVDLMLKAGLKVRIDRFANIIGRLEPYPFTYSKSKTSVIMCGSHIDTVPNGGYLDGAYGVIAGIEALKAIRLNGVRHRHPIEVISFTEEEGARFPAFLGSKGFTGQLSKEQAYSLKDGQGITFLGAMKQSGLKPEELSESMYQDERVGAYVELHIEQGPVLENSGKMIGIVNSIVGLGDLEIKVLGKASHAGTTPMTERKDALVSASKIVLQVNEIAKRSGGRAVATVGKLSLSPNASNVIPGVALLGIDFRSSSISLLNKLKDDIIRSAKDIGNKDGLEILPELKLFAEPAGMSRLIMSTIERVSKKMRYDSLIMPSGAGHDCQNMAKITDTGMIFVPSHLGLSHCKDEYTPPDNLGAGANVLVNTLIDLAR